ncbi:FxsB family cyclophane-forming radical SAM/SPASM peptide maturase [Pseudofrankia sp. BMG5.37]|uniref:FxsB family cyclophane-forming radical SAM/SPASM peptide maturase n=1 Tax=Pseudofrankia sp. BMG5.37 TaxID=3050035 RepID=UPI002893FDC8|nr:FxsB family cyclophane-forming radical SAM/SPASM peptide maturase [Pseudofrankia sp. BMG5.37]MDT3445394.1 FxsB family cyclophane-forming radical SAM/SPASM peptide maturase [Pseudofrankia sp. BMG5.37]
MTATPRQPDQQSGQLASQAPRPIQEYIVKVASRCNLDCEYCYIYHLADQSWRRQPRFMSPATVVALADRLAEHARAHDLASMRIWLQGGEPLLAGPDRLRQLVDTVRARLAPTTLAVAVQTNGVLLDEATARFLVDADIHVGISLDGDQAANDLRRLFPDGRSSYDAARAAIEVMLRPEFRSHLLGVLCTIQLDAAPEQVWEGLLGLGVPAVDFLLPHGTWEHPPRGVRPGRPPGGADTPYADWLIGLFDRWFDAPVQPVSVRIFEDLLHLLLGGAGGFEAFGLAPVALAVVETDGSYEQIDPLKAVGEGATATGLNIFDDRVDDLLALPGILERQRGLAALAAECRRCELVAVCGGGYYPHRHRAGSEFTNPSVYCADLYALISHIQRRAADALARRGTTLAAVRAV